MTGFYIIPGALSKKVFSVLPMQLAMVGGT
jgi:hypothetical protein